MIPERAGARTRPDLLTVLGSTASACGFSVNSVLVHLGDAFGLYPTGQYSFDHELPDTSPRRRHWWRAGFGIRTQRRYHRAESPTGLGQADDQLHHAQQLESPRALARRPKDQDADDRTS